MLSVPPLRMLGVDDDERGAWLTAQLVPQPLATFTDPVKHSTERLPVARQAIVCTPSVMPFEEIAVRNGFAISRIEAGHHVMVTRPREVADLLLAFEGSSSPSR